MYKGSTHYLFLKFSGIQREAKMCYRSKASHLMSVWYNY